jgi:hypothetical protein
MKPKSRPLVLTRLRQLQCFAMDIRITNWPSVSTQVPRILLDVSKPVTFSYCQVNTKMKRQTMYALLVLAGPPRGGVAGAVPAQAIHICRQTPNEGRACLDIVHALDAAPDAHDGHTASLPWTYSLRLLLS